MSKTFELASWFPVITVKEQGDNDLCTLCRNFVYEKCILCTKDMPYDPNKMCNIEYNLNCDHSYHAHCIQNWTKTNKTCPVDMAVWGVCNKAKSGSCAAAVVKVDKESVEATKKASKPKLANKKKSKYVKGVGVLI